MYTRRTFLMAAGAGLWTLAGTGRWAQAAAAPAPTDVVKQFLAARTAQNYAKAYALLSADTQKQVSSAQFADPKFFEKATPHADEDGVTPQMFAVGVFFMDTHDTTGFVFTVVGPDPADPRVVLVSVQSSTKTTSGTTVPPLLLHIATAPDPQGMPRLELASTFDETSPNAFEHARERARQAVSMSNLKTVGLSFFQYCQDHAEHMPIGDHWTDAIMRYLGNTSKLHDPSAPDGPQFSYAFNRNLSGVSLSKIEQPAATVLLFTSTLGIKNASDTGQSLPRPGWHSGGSIVAMADTHVKWVKDGTVLNFKP